jgi:beta-glucanase (GH16 family)
MRCASSETEESEPSSYPCKRSLRLLLAAITILGPAMFAAGAAGQQSTTADSTSKVRTLVWSDEFNGADGSMPDPAKWKVVSNGSGYGNRELEYYTDRPANIHEENGHLVINARREPFTGADGQARSFTSARIESQGRFELKYGRIEARIRIPSGQGIWPAFWMLGTDYDRIGWPACGEIDIMENVGFEPSRIHGSLHGPGYSGSNPLSGFYTLPNQDRFSDGFHTFAIEWEPGKIRFYVDDVLYETQTAGDVPAGAPWAFDHPFFLVLDVAVGGYWPGDPNATTPFPATMLVDYVRVYRMGEERAEAGHP